MKKGNYYEPIYNFMDTGDTIIVQKTFTEYGKLPANIRNAISGLCYMLQSEKLEKWLNPYGEPKNKKTIGIGAGQTSRVDSSRIAIQKYHENFIDKKEKLGCVIASDAFFPFSDGLTAAIEFGVKAVIQPGGSIRDDDVIKTADEAEVAMVFTGYRHFKH